MKMFKKLICFVLAVCLILTLAACHPKGEVAVKSGDYEITSAMYSYYLVMADSTAKSIIAADDTIDKTASGFSYYKQKIEGKSFEEYVKDLALENCLKHIAFEKLVKDNKVEISDADKTGAENQANYYWNYYGYGAVYEANGVSYDTYAKIMLNSVLSDSYFKSIYAKDGTKAVADTDIQKALDENYAAAYILTKDYSSDQSANVDELKATFEGYKTRLLAGEAFKTIYNEYNKVTEENTNTTTTDTTTPAPQDEYISVIGSDKTGLAYDKFEDVKKMAVNTCEVISDETNKVIYLVVKKDINADSYYRDEYLMSDILYLLKGEEFDASIDKYIDELDYTVNKFAINQFKVKKIEDGSTL